MNYFLSFFGNNKEKEKPKKNVDEKNIPDLNNYAFDFNVNDKKKETNQTKQNTINEHKTTINIISNNNKDDEDEPLEEIIKKEPIEISLNNNDNNIIKENIEPKKQVLTEVNPEKKEKEEEVITEIILEKKEDKDNNIIKDINENKEKKTKKKKIKKVKKGKTEIKEAQNLKNKEEEEERKIIILEEKKNEDIINENIIQEKTENNKENNERKKEPISLQEVNEKNEEKIEIIISQNDDNIIEINNQNERKISLEGPENSPYENGHFEISINYDKATGVKPVIKFLTKIYHYNIAQKNGEVLCPFIWNENNNEEENIKNIKALLIRPDIRFPCSKFIKDEYYNNYPSYKEKAQRFTENYAMD